MHNQYESYYICLDAISHRTHWKGWLRQELAM
jgi:hypothetical protein